jgi:hypothetical protein
MAVVLLGVSYLALRGQLDSSLALLTGTDISFLTLPTIAAMILGGGLIGAFGSALSLRRYLSA